MRDSLPSTRYSHVCNVLCLWRFWLIPTYRVYRLYDSMPGDWIICGLKFHMLWYIGPVVLYGYSKPVGLFVGLIFSRADGSSSSILSIV